MTIVHPAFCLFLYLTDVHFRGELQHDGDISQQKTKKVANIKGSFTSVMVLLYLTITK